MEIETLHLLSEAEIRAGLKVFCEARDQHAEEGRPGLAGIYAALAAALQAEKVRRKLLFREHERELKDADFTWGDVI
jgi:hypothetical protein